MKRNGAMHAGATDGSEARIETRRSLLTKAGVAAGGVGVVALARSDSALATDGPGLDFEDLQFDGFNDVKDPQFAGGAVGDGANNDRAAIQACIDASATSSPPKTVYFPPGTYLIGSTLNLRDKSVLVGHGSLSVLKRNFTFGHLIQNLGIGGAGNDDIVIDNLTLDANGQLGTSVLRIQATGTNKCERIFLRRLEVRNHNAAGSGVAVGLGNVQYCVFRDGYVHECGTGISIRSASLDVIVQGNVLAGCTADSIAVTDTGGGPPERISVLGNVCNAMSASSGAVIAVRGATDVSVIGNGVQGGYHGIEVTASPSSVSDVNVADNMILEAGSIPLAQTNSDPGWGDGVLVKATTSGKTVARVSVRNNVVVSPRYHGVSLEVPSNNSGASLSDIAVSGNQVRVDASKSWLQGSGSGIASLQPYIGVTEVRVIDNDVRGTQESGIKIQGRPSGSTSTLVNWDVSGNRVSQPASGKHGVHADTVSNLSVAGNRVVGVSGGGYGLRLANPTLDIVVEGNTLADSASGAASLTETAGARRLRVRDNPGFSPWAKDEQLSNWGPGPSFVAEVAVAFAVHFPSGSSPQVFATVKPASGTNLDAYAIAKDVSATGFTLRVVSSTDPGLNTHKASWLAEPTD